MPKKIKLDVFHGHEALDRTDCVLRMVDLLLVSHPWVEQHPEVAEKIEAASEMLAEAYQMIGNRTDDERSE